MGFWSITRPRHQDELAGMEKVENRDTYKLKLTMKAGRPCTYGLTRIPFWKRRLKGSPGCWTALPSGGSLLP